jgi:hypothetical protein
MAAMTSALSSAAAALDITSANITALPFIERFIVLSQEHGFIYSVRSLRPWPLARNHGLALATSC